MIRPSAAATVLLVRGGTAALEVLMLERRADSGFVPGAYVFPGGGVDAADHRPELHAHTDGPDDATASVELDLPSGGLAHRVAAVRECFEEAGVLLGATAGGPVPASLVAELQPDRHRLDTGHTDLVDLCRRHELTLTTAALRPFAHWVTPIGPPRRYDTRFFVAEAPPDQPASPDGTEVVEACWITPAEALDRSAAGRFPLILPTERCLEAILPYASAAELLAAVDAATLDGVRFAPDRGGRRLVLTASGSRVGSAPTPSAGSVA